MGGKLAGHAKSIETIGRLVSNTASFGICAEKTVSSSAAMQNKYHEKGAKLSGETALEILGIGLNVAGMAASGKGIVESGNRLGRMVKEGGTTNKMSKGISKGGGKSGTPSTKPNQIHHFATNKSKKYTSQFENIAKKYGLDLDGDWNKELMPHQGSHPYAYHEYVLDNMQKFDKIAKGDKTKFLMLYDQMKQKIISNPNMLYKDYWNK